jgi:cob(I)alamin adenosyltransferase
MVKLNKIYTKTGDDGTTGLVDGSRISKSSALMAAIGDVDEANSAIGVAVVALDADHPARALLLTIQNDLFDLGADLATPPNAGAEDPFAPIEWHLRVTASQVARLETEIDAANDQLEPLNSFILPGGSEGAARLHVARAMVRRAERSAVAANSETPLNPQAMMYLNRLSDHLFVHCRLINGGKDPLWVPGASR